MGNALHTYLRPVLLLLLAGLVLSACRGPGIDSVATVNGVGIPRELLERLVTAEALASAGSATEIDEAIPGIADPASRSASERTNLRSLIIIEIVRQLADDLGVLVSDEDIQSRWEIEVAAGGGGEEDLLSYIDSIGLTEAEYRDFVMGHTARIEAIEEAVSSDVAVSDEDIAAAFELSGPVATASHILVATLDEALDLKQQLDDGASFVALASEHSLDTGSAQLGGSLGQQTQGFYVPEFDDYVWSGEVGAVSDPVETDFGFHLILIHDREEGLEDATPRLREQLENQGRTQAVQEEFNRAIDDADVVIDSAIGRWDPTIQDVVSDDPLDAPPVTDPFDFPTSAPTP